MVTDQCAACGAPLEIGKPRDWVSVTRFEGDGESSERINVDGRYHLGCAADAIPCVEADDG